MEIIFFIINMTVSLCGALSISNGDLILSLLVLGISFTNIIFAINYSTEISIKYSNSLLVLNLIGGIFFSGFIFVMNDFFSGEFRGTLLFTILSALYIGLNTLYIKSVRRELSISEPENKEVVVFSKEAQDSNNNTKPGEDHYLTPASDLFIDEQIVNIDEEKEYMPVPRKVNWDTVQKARKQTGDFGEAIVLEYERTVLLKQGKQRLSKKVALVSSKNLGYDVFSKSDDGSDKYIEVKSFAKDTARNFIVTRNELNFLQENPDSSFIFMVTDCDTEPKIIKMDARQFFKLILKPSVFKITL